jgi:medium-chain acyl-[acyl-carrier-protein] hydrolase
MTWRPTRINEWFLRPFVVPDARSRVLILHHAGGSSAPYFPLARLIRAGVEPILVDLPGRGSRFREPALTDGNKIIGELEKALRDCSDLPFSLFGYSLGGLLSYRLGLRLSELSLPLPTHLFLLACKPPVATETRPDWDRSNLLHYLNEMGGTPREVLEHPELLDVTLRVLSNDLKVFGSEFGPARPISVPITTMNGTSDKHASPESALGWGAFTSQRLERLVFSGGHFFIHQCESEVAHAINSRLS